MLKMAGCNELQGYHFGRPASLAQALKMAAPTKQEIAVA
jgi:EAL domain-containing protein (putative c-di-GMP-specific phosphodiesterase class I)